MDLSHVNIVFQIIVFLLAISVHESAHAWMANRQGDPTAKMLGRITLNPIKHIDPIGTVLLPLIGIFAGAGIFGWEADLAYTPEFFEGDDDDIDLIDNSNVTTFMFNAIIGAPVGGTTGGGFRPYFSGGLGLMQSNVSDAESLFEVNNSEFGINLGGGAMGFVSDHVGFRGDVRYFRQLSDPVEDNEFDVALGDLDFWRATGGITFRW